MGLGLAFKYRRRRFRFPFYASFSVTDDNVSTVHCREPDWHSAARDCGTGAAGLEHDLVWRSATARPGQGLARPRSAEI